MDMKQYWIIGSVNYYLNHESSTPSYDVWDQIKWLSTGLKSPIEQQFFKPFQPPSENSESKLWEIIDPPEAAIRLRVSRAKETYHPSLEGSYDDTGGMLALLHGLCDRKDWPRVKKGFRLVSSPGRSFVSDSHNASSSMIIRDREGNRRIHTRDRERD